MKRKLSLLVVCGLLATVLSACGENSKSGSASKDSYTVAISQIVKHPSLDAVKEGIVASLADQGLKEGENLVVDFHDAQGDSNNIQPISQKIAQSKADVAVGIATPTAIGLVDEITDKPVVFAAVSDPVDAKLVPQYEKPGGNVTGASDSSPEAIKLLIDFIAKEFTDVKKVGIVINNGEPNAVVMADTAAAIFNEHGIEVVKAAIANSSDVQQAAQSLVGRVDAIYITLDNTVVEAVDSIIEVAYEHDIPFFSSDFDTVAAGTLATYGFRYYDHGYEVGQIIGDILLNGKNPGDIDVLTPKAYDFIINEKAAVEMGVTLTESMLNNVKDKDKNLLK